MALRTGERHRLLAETSTTARQDRTLVLDYLARTGLSVQDLGDRCGYSHQALNFFLRGKYELVAGTDLNIRKALREFIAAHPIGGQDGRPAGKLYETDNVRLLRKYFHEALERQRAYYVEGDPGTQKSFVLEHLVEELNRGELAKNGAGRRAYYVYCPEGATPLRLMKRIAEACGAIAVGGTDRIIRNLRFDFRGRKVLLVLDEAQHLSIACMEAVRELYDRPPRFGLLFAGSHAFGELFKRNALRLEQWNSRFQAGKQLPGIGEDEAREIIRAELNGRSNDKVVAALLKGARMAHLRSGGRETYISARRLFDALAKAKAVTA